MSVALAAFYGHTARPLSAGHQKLVDNMGVARTGINQASRGKTVALIVASGPAEHPAARIVTDLFKHWYRLLDNFRAKFGSLNLIKQAWRALLEAFTREGHRVVPFRLGGKKPRALLNRQIATRSTSGIVSNVFYTLVRLGWTPLSFDVWEARQTGANISLVLKDLVASLNKEGLRKASKHGHGTGLEAGVNWHATLANVVKCRKAEEFCKAAAIETQLAAGS